MYPGRNQELKRATAVAVLAVMDLRPWGFRFGCRMGHCAGTNPKLIVDDPAARRDAIWVWFPDEYPIPKQGPVHQINLGIGRDFTDHRIARWHGEDIECNCRAHD
jgi:hypothetical protein